MLSRLAFALIAALVSTLLVACGATARASRSPMSLTLDWTPNPDHVGFYDALETGRFARAGLAVTIRAPSDPTAPLKLVAAGHGDLAVTYEQELFFASAKHLPVVAVAAVVPRPLNSFMAIDPSIRSIRELKGRTIGISGVPSDYATLDTALHTVGLERSDVKVVVVGYNLLPALLAHRVDAVLGVYRNVEGIQLRLRGLHPTIIPVDQAGIPGYDELVLAANKTRLTNDEDYRSRVHRFVAAFLAGTIDARAHPGQAVAILRKVTASDPAFLARATHTTLGLLAGRGGVGCLSRSAWQRFATWMHNTGLLAQPVNAATVLDTSFLPARCRTG